MLYYEYVKTGTSGLYAKTAAGVSDTTITRMWRGTTPLTKLADGIIPTSDDTWARGADPDSIYVKLLNADAVDSLSADVFTNGITITSNHSTVQGLVIKQTNGFMVAAYGDSNNVYNCFADSTVKGVLLSGVRTTVQNNSFRLMAASQDSIFPEPGSNGVYSYNAFDNGAGYIVPSSPGANDVLTSPLYTGDYEPVEALRDQGINVGLSYNGTAPEIGPVELDALAAENGVVSRRRVFDAESVPVFDGGMVPVFEP
jgi:hypothetical protein